MKIYAAQKKLDLDRLNQMKQETPPTGYRSDASFITADGYYIDLLQRGYSSHFHFYIDMFDLFDKIPDSWDETNHPDKYDNYFVEKYNWIRLRIIRQEHYLIIILPKSVNSSQWSALEDWLKSVEQQYKSMLICISIIGDSLATAEAPGFGTQFFTEDVISACKRYYSSGVLPQLA